MGCMRFCPACSICPLKAVGAGELQQGRAGKTGAAVSALAVALAALNLVLALNLALEVGAPARKKGHLSSR